MTPDPLPLFEVRQRVTIEFVHRVEARTRAEAVAMALDLGQLNASETHYLRESEPKAVRVERNPS